ncbi:structural protein, partial [Roseomonas eburnea]|nr:structural protein [Neoroseomonas eburnea]
GTAAAGDGGVAVAQAAAELAPHLGAATELARALGPWLAAALIVAVAGWFIWQRSRRAA